jgi:hypothetical protein
MVSSSFTLMIITENGHGKEEKAVGSRQKGDIRKRQVEADG